MEHETELALASVNSTDTLFQQHIGSLRKNVGFFVENLKGEIQHLAEHPEDELSHNNFDKLIEKYFSDAITYTMADSDGEVLLSNLEGLVGKGCQDNIRLFAIDSQQSDAQIRIHHNRSIAHFDIMHELHASNGQLVIFFVTFTPKTLASYIANFQLPGHELVLVKKNTDFTIELTELGSKVDFTREPSVTISEKNRILAKKDIPNTLWQLVDIIEEENIQKANSSIIRDFGVIFLAFALGILLAAFSYMKHEKAHL